MKLLTVEHWLAAYDKVREPQFIRLFFFNSKLPSSWITRACQCPQFEKLEKLVVRPGIEPGSPAVMASALTTELPNRAR